MRKRQKTGSKEREQSTSGTSLVFENDDERNFYVILDIFVRFPSFFLVSPHSIFDGFMKWFQ